MFPMNPAEAGARTNREQWIALTPREWASFALGSLIFTVAFSYPMLCEVGGVSVPVKLYSEHGLIAVRLPDGRQRLSLRFQPSHITVVFAITLVAAVGSVTLWLVDL
jgi:uncharacterized membrane protein YfhO